MARHGAKGAKKESNKQYGLWAIETVMGPRGSWRGSGPACDDVKPWGRGDSAMGVDSVTFRGHRG